MTDYNNKSNSTTLQRPNHFCYYPTPTDTVALQDALAMHISLPLVDPIGGEITELANIASAVSIRNTLVE